MPWAVLGYLLMPLGLEGWALTPMGWGIEAMIAVARWVAGWPGAVVLLPAMPVWGLALVALGGLWLCLWQRRWRLLGLLVIAGGLAALPSSRSPDVLVAGDARMFAVRAEDGRLMLSSETGNRFARENWLRRAGLKSAAPWPREASPGGRLRCDEKGCIYRARGHTVALIKHPGAFLEDCWVADVIVSLVPLRGAHCPAPQTVIDRFDIWRNGAYALWLDDGRVRIENVRQHQGERPWAPPKKPRRARAR